MDDAPALRMPESSSGGDPERNVRAHVHLALASIILTFAAPLVSWMFWLADRHRPPGIWRRRLLGIALLDTFLIVGLAVSTAFGIDVDRATRGTPRIGIVVDAREEGGGHQGAVVEEVVPGSPAATAAIEHGDRIVAIDGKPIERGEELTKEIAATPKDHERRLEVIRKGAPMEVKVTPTTAKLTKVARPPKPLFAPSHGDTALGHTASRSSAWAAATLELVLVGALAVRARSKRMSAGPGLAVLAGLIALPVASAAVVVAFKTTLGISLGALLVSILAGSLALLVVGLLALRITPTGVQVGPLIRTPKAIALGIFYGMTGAARVAILLTIAVAVLRLPVHSAAEAFGLDVSWGAAAVVLFLVASVLVAPIAEEVLFRGVLLPWLTRWMRPGAALAWATAVFAIGHLYYGAGVILIFLYGLVLGWARLRTGNLTASIALHSLLNGVTALTLLATSQR